MKILKLVLAGLLLSASLVIYAGQYTPIPPASVQPVGPVTPYCNSATPTVWAGSFQMTALSGVTATTITAVDGSTGASGVYVSTINATTGAVGCFIPQ